MARAFDDEWRRKFLASGDGGTDGLKAVALYFGVSHGWARQGCQPGVAGTGRAERARHRPGPKTRMTPEAAVCLQA